MFEKNHKSTVTTLAITDKMLKKGGGEDNPPITRKNVNDFEFILCYITTLNYLYLWKKTSLTDLTTVDIKRSLCY
jgi:hypothetical protein